jgi:hypothetical protein
MTTSLEKRHTVAPRGHPQGVRVCGKQGSDILGDLRWVRVLRRRMNPTLFYKHFKIPKKVQTNSLMPLVNQKQHTVKARKIVASCVSCCTSIESNLGK